MEVMSNTPRLVCEDCGADLTVARVGEEAWEPGMRLLCDACGEAHEDSWPASGRGVNRAAILTSVGLFVLLVSVLADVLAFGSHSGFGWKQGLFLGLAGVLILTGAMVRISTLFVIGLIIGLLTLLADWLGFGNAPGFGWHQVSGSLLGASLIAAGLAVARTMTRDE